VIVSLHVATGAAAGAAAGSRLSAVALGLLAHLAGDRIPHQDIDSRPFEIGTGVILIALLAVHADLDVLRPKCRLAVDRE
jgi:hypothetical protein